MAVGDKVLLPEFGGQKISLSSEEFDLFRDAEFLGKFVEEWKLEKMPRPHDGANRSTQLLILEQNWFQLFIY